MRNKKGARGVKDAERLSMGGLTACPNYSKGGLKMQHIVPAKWRTGRPEEDGEYLVIDRFRRRTTLNFTVEGGWNTHRSYSGELYAEHALGDDSVRFWLDVEDPEVTP